MLMSCVKSDFLGSSSKSSSASNGRQDLGTKVIKLYVFGVFEELGFGPCDALNWRDNVTAQLTNQ